MRGRCGDIFLAELLRGKRYIGGGVVTRFVEELSWCGADGLGNGERAEILRASLSDALRMTTIACVMAAAGYWKAAMPVIFSPMTSLWMSLVPS